MRSLAQLTLIHSTLYRTFVSLFSIKKIGREFTNILLTIYFYSYSIILSYSSIAFPSFVPFIDDTDSFLFSHSITFIFHLYMFIDSQMPSQIWEGFGTRFATGEIIVRTKYSSGGNPGMDFQEWFSSPYSLPLNKEIGTNR